MEDGTRVVVPLISNRVGKVFKTYTSMAPGVYGGPITDGRVLEQEEIDVLLRSIISPKVVKISVTGNPLWAYELPDHFHGTEDFTHILDLRQGFDFSYRNWSKGHRWAPKKARKEGISVRPATREEEVLEYYQCYQDCLKRWGDRARSYYPVSLFLNIFKNRGDQVQLWVAMWKGRVVAGSVVLYCNKHAVYWHNAAREEFFSKYPNNLLQYEIIKEACERGFEFYDFNPSGSAGNLEGVVKFKSHFGAEKCPIRQWTYVNAIHKYGRSLKRRLKTLL
jgi:lipid II:glycine glycyltransferase (peptidoglycan interpeptide bridge formation enzyme)